MKLTGRFILLREHDARVIERIIQAWLDNHPIAYDTSLLRSVRDGLREARRDRWFVLSETEPPERIVTLWSPLNADD